MVTLPEEIIRKIKQNIQPQWKMCFWAAVVIGLVAHLYKIANWLPNWDSLVFRYDEQNMIAIGRWFLPVAAAFSSFYDLPWLTGLLTILLHGLGAVCICKMFGVRKNTTAVLIGAAAISFPVVTSVLMYNYVADAYALSFLFACAAALLLLEKKPKYIAATVLIALSMGIYQAYITVTIMLLLCHLIIQTLEKGTKVKTLLLKSAGFLLTGIAAVILYYLILVIVLKITKTTLLEYQGISNAMSLSNLDILGALYTIKESFMSYFFDFSKGCSVFVVVNIVVCVLAIAFYTVDAIRNKLKVTHILLLCAYVILLPIGASVLSFINSGVDYHNLMKMGFFAFYLLFILQYEKCAKKLPRYNAYKAWLVVGVTAVLIFNQIVIANVSYHKLTMAYEKSYGTLIRIADRIEQTEGAEDCESILVLGALAGGEAYSSEFPPDMTGTTDGLILRADDEVVGQSVLCSALNDYCQKDYKFIAGSEKTQLLQKLDTDSLCSWPAKNSICVVDNVIVIKLGD